MSSNVNQPASNLQLGSTWSNAGLNIDIDNLTVSGNRNKSGGGPSMNQLATNSPSSPLGRQGLGSAFGNIMPSVQPNPVVSPTMPMMGGMMGSVPSSGSVAPLNPMMGNVPGRMPGMAGMPSMQSMSGMPGVIPSGAAPSLPGMAPLGMMQPNSMPANSNFFPAAFQ